MLKTLPELVSQARSSLNVITALEAKEKIKQLNALMIDVREPNEFEQQSIVGAVNIPRGILEPQMLARFADENLAIFMHCASGARATFAGEQLVRMGYQHVWVISCALDEIKHAFRLEQ